MKKLFFFISGMSMMVSLWAANMGTVSIYGGYNNWVLGQLFTSQIEQPTNANTSISGGGISFG
ncbi:MAG: hypothetical protein ACK4TN_05485 [Brevinematales bacterium]